MGECQASYEAVMEKIEEGDTGCPLCGGSPEEHDHEAEFVLEEGQASA